MWNLIGNHCGSVGLENIELILVVVVPALSGFFALVGSLIVRWWDRDKVTAEVSSIQADATATMAAAVAKMAESVGKTTKMLQDQKTITDKRDERIDVLERQARASDELIAQLRIDLAKVTEAAAVKDKVIAEQNEQIATLTERVNRLRSEREADQARISTLELEKVSLLKDAGNDKNEPKSEQKPTIGTEIVVDGGDVVS